MKNTLFLVLAVLFLSSNAYAASLYESLSREGSVPFAVETITDSSKDKKVDTAGLKAAVEKAMTERKSIHFKQAADAKDAKIKIKVNVTDSYWSDHDPVDMLVGVGAAAMDAAVVEDYAFMQADVQVLDDKDKTLWSDKLVATVTKKDMSADQSVPLINESFAKSLLKSAFSKKSHA